MENNRVAEITKTALVSALYVAMTLLVSPVAFGPIQFRISEALNFLGLYNIRYVWAITIGCFIVNMANGPVDMIVGTFHTLVSLLLSRKIGEWASEKFANEKRKPLVIKHIVMILVFTFTMFIIAAMLYFAFDAPFWYSYLTLALSELIVMTLSSFIMYPLAQRIDFTK